MNVLAVYACNAVPPTLLVISILSALRADIAKLVVEIPALAVPINCVAQANASIKPALVHAPANAIVLLARCAKTICVNRPLMAARHPPIAAVVLLIVARLTNATASPVNASIPILNLAQPPRIALVVLVVRAAVFVQAQVNVFPTCNAPLLMKPTHAALIFIATTMVPVRCCLLAPPTPNARPST